MPTSLPKKLSVALACVAACLAASPSSHASDHIDGLKTALDNAADLTDVFAFVSPQDSTRLVLIMDVHPLAFSSSQFSDAVNYTFRIRPVPDATLLTPSSDPTQEVTIVCTFAGGVPLIDPTQTATCNFNFLDGTDTLTFPTRTGDYTAGGSGQDGQTRAFAGVRSDPWFLDLGKILKLNGGQPISSDPGTNGLAGQNVLSIVVEVDKGHLPGSLLAITAQTVRQ